MCESRWIGALVTKNSAMEAKHVLLSSFFSVTKLKSSACCFLVASIF